MVQSRARTVDEYLAALPPDRRAVLSRLRNLAQTHLPGFQEGMEYGMPFYRGPHGATLGLASQVKYVAIYAGEAAAAKARESGLDVGKSCIRLSKLDSIDWKLIADVIRRCAS